MTKRSASRQRAVRQLLEERLDERGAKAGLARALGVSHGYVRKMVKEGHVAAEHTLGVADFIGVSPDRIRRDLYPPDRLRIIGPGALPAPSRAG